MKQLNVCYSTYISFNYDFLHVVSPATRAYLKGKSLSFFDEDESGGAEELLSKAVKLTPSNHMAWIALGQCLWKKGSLQQAENFFLESLKYRPTPQAYQELSMLIRQIQSSTNQAEVMERSINYAKKAIELDLTDHKSWYIYGNALCMKFFRVTYDLNDLQRALVAYKKSISLGGNCNPDLYYNQGNCYRYLQDYLHATHCYQQAIALDPSFTLANECQEDVEGYLVKTRDMVLKKGGIQKKRLNKILERLQSSPYSRQSETISTLVDGANTNKTISVCILGVATRSAIPPESFLFVDKDGNCGIVSIYNLGHDTPPPSPDQIFTIHHPVYHRSMVQSEESKDEESARITPDRDVPLIQVYRLDQLQVNGKTISWRALATPELTVDLFDS